MAALRPLRPITLLRGAAELEFGYQLVGTALG